MGKRRQGKKRNNLFKGKAGSSAKEQDHHGTISRRQPNITLIKKST